MIGEPWNTVTVPFFYACGHVKTGRVLTSNERAVIEIAGNAKYHDCPSCRRLKMIEEYERGTRR